MHINAVVVPVGATRKAKSARVIKTILSNTPKNRLASVPFDNLESLWNSESLHNENVDIGFLCLTRRLGRFLIGDDRAVVSILSRFAWIRYAALDRAEVLIALRRLMRDGTSALGA